MKISIGVERINPLLLYLQNTEYKDLRMNYLPASIRVFLSRQILRLSNYLSDFILKEVNYVLRRVQINIMTGLRQNQFQDTLYIHFGIHTCQINQTYLYCFLLKNLRNITKMIHENMVLKENEMNDVQQCFQILFNACVPAHIASGK